MRRGVLLRRQAVAAADGQDLPSGFGERRDDVEVERLAERARLLGPIEHRDPLHGRGQGGQEVLGRERPVDADLDEADLLAARDHPLDQFVRDLGARAHHDDDALGFGVADVVEEVVLAADERRELVHRLLEGGRGGVVEQVARLARLEEGVGVLGGPAEDRLVRRERAGPVSRHQVLGDHRPQILVRQLFDLRNLVRGAEAVKVVEHRNAGPQGRPLADRREVVGLLHRPRGQHPEPRLAARHDVGVIPEDRQRVRGHGARRHVHAERGQLARDLVHVRDHQEQALRRREGRREGARLQRAVNRAGSAAFRLHLGHRRDGAPDVLLAFRRPLIRPFAHVGRRRDGVDGDDLVRPVGDRGDGLIAVDRDARTCHMMAFSD